MNPTSNEMPLVLITGSSGLIGTRLAKALCRDYRVAGLDIKPPTETVLGTTWTECDMTDTKSVGSALHHIEQEFGRQIASVIHLAAYYDFSGEPSPLYRDLTVEGTRRLMKQLQLFDIQQFVFSSTLLVMQSSEADHPIDAYSPVEAEWDYPRSNLAAEKVIQEERNGVPAVVLRMAGVYDEDGHSLPIAQQISRIYEKQLESCFFPGDKTCGQAFIHLDDVAECFRHVIQCRESLAPHEVFVIGEEDVMSYGELQDEVGKMIHGKEWPAVRMPKTAAKAGAWAKEKLARGGERHRSSSRG
jgi:nucleoside-diphosphate-sugar epimerase